MRQILVLIAAAGSAALLLGALAFQYLGGLYPCPYCLLQRWPHLAAVLIGLVALRVKGWLLPVLGAGAALTTAAIGLFHTGVERGWVEGSSSCTSAGMEGLSAADLVERLKNAPLASCDQVAWEMFGLSMASWNALLSLVLVAVWIMAARQSRSAL